MTSCQKEDTIVDQTGTVEEGNLSTTNNIEQLEIDETTAEKPVFHKSFSSDLTKEEAKAEWTKAVDEYIKALPKEEVEERSHCSGFYMSVQTLTGSQLYAGTDGSVSTKIYLKSSKGDIQTKWYSLNNPGDDRERGDWDFYLVRYDNSSSLNWFGIESTKLALKGTDGWYVKYFDVYIQKPSGTTGYSNLISDPLTWLDSSQSYLWDYYTNAYKGKGIIYC